MGESTGSCVPQPLANDVADELTDVGLSLLSQLRQASTVVFGLLGLTYGQAMLLVLVEQGFTRPKELTQRLGMVFPAFSSLVTHLAGAELLERVLDPADGRRVEVRLTSSGIDMCRKIREAWREAKPLDISALSDAQIAVFLEAARAASKPSTH